MRFLPTDLEGAYLVEIDRYEDERGHFSRVFCANACAEIGFNTSIVQANESFNRHQGTLRGMHYQLPPHAETKLVRCVRGKLWDCIVDIRPNSPTCGQWFGAELSPDNRRMMYCPKGFAHGFITLEADTEALYFVDAFYAPQSERGIRWDDPKFGINWPIAPTVISDKDRNHRDFDPVWHLDTHTMKQES